MKINILIFIILLITILIGMLILRNNEPFNNTKKVAIVFNGLIRSLNYTISNLNDCIFKPLKENGYDYDIYCHNFILNRPYDNNITINKDDYLLLNPKYYLSDDQDKILKEIDINKYLTLKDPWDNNYKSLKNYILSMWSKNKITKLLESNIKQGMKYDYVMFVRSDVLFNNKFDTNFFNLIKNDNDCLIPNFHHWAGYNDRFFVSKPSLAINYGTYIDYIYDIIKETGNYSELINKKMLYKYNANVILIDFKFKRLRPDRTFAETDINYP